MPRLIPIILLALLSACSQAPEYPDRLRVNGISMRLHYAGDPARPPLLFIHGNGGTWQKGQFLMDYFQPDYFVLAADNRYHGESGFDEQELSYELMAQDYQEMLGALGIDSAYVLGESDGGIIALLLAMQAPQLVKKIVATGVNIRPDSSAIIASDLEGLTAEIRRLEAKLVQDDSAAEDLQSLAQLRLIAEHPNLANKDLAAVSCPVLLLNGAHDVIKRTHSETIAAHLPNGQLKIIEACSHDVVGERPDSLLRYSEAFFRR